MGVEVRPAATTDVAGIQRVAEAAWHEAHAPIIGTETVEAFLAEFYGADAFRSLLERDDAVLEVAVADGGDVVGFVSAAPDDETPGAYQLGRLYVVPDRWGEGVGGQLLDRAEDEVRDRDGERVSLGVMAENDRAVAFYESAGYRRVDTFHDDRIGADGYTYEKAV